jgi:hypothetical protein
MAKIGKLVNFDSDMLDAAKRHAEAVSKESLNAMIVRAVRELLERANAWPPPKKGK